MLAPHSMFPAAQAAVSGVNQSTAAQAGTAGAEFSAQAGLPGLNSFSAVLKEQMEGTQGKENSETASLLALSGDAALNDGIAALVAALMSPTQKTVSLPEAGESPLSHERPARLGTADVTTIRGMDASLQAGAANESLTAGFLQAVAPAVAQTVAKPSISQGGPGLPASGGLSSEHVIRRPEDTLVSSAAAPALTALPGGLSALRPGAATEGTARREGDFPLQPTMNPGLPASPSETAVANVAGLRTGTDFTAPTSAAEISARPAGFAPVSALAGEAQNAAPFSEALTSAQAQASLAQGLTGATEARFAAPHSASLPQTRIDTPLNHPGWDHELGDKLVWAVGRHEQKAELVITPPQLGRVEVSLQQQGEQTHAVFVAANPAVREALENALPRLREMFAEAGLSLGQASVGSGSGNSDFRQSFADSGNREDSSSYSRAETQDSGGNMSRQTGPVAWVRQGRGMVDVFA